MEKNKSLNHSTVSDPYYFLFPMAYIAGVIGVTLWVLFSFQEIRFFPREAHSRLMFFGMMWAFVAGFLMTAVPRMSAASRANRIEISMAACFVLLQMILSFSADPFYCRFVFLLQSLFLMVFILRRFLKTKKSMPFLGFIFLPAAFLQALLSFFLTTDWMVLAGEAFLLNLILGLGGRLVPMISKIAGTKPPSEKMNGERVISIFGVLLLLNFGYWIQVLGFREWGIGLRFVAIIWGCIRLLRLFERPSQWGMTGVGLKVGQVFLAMGMGLSYFYGVAGMHVLYIGGFLLITMMISTRVMLAHGGQDLAYEIDSKRILAIVALLSFAGIGRFVSGVQFFGYSLVFAAIAFLLACFLWMDKFRKVYHFRKDNCSD